MKIRSFISGMIAAGAIVAVLTGSVGIGDTPESVIAQPVRISQLSETPQEAFAAPASVIATSSDVPVRTSHNTRKRSVVAMWENHSATWYVGVPEGSLVSLQRLIGSRYTTVQQTKVSKTSSVSFTFLKGSTATKGFKESYRLYVPAYPGFLPTVSAVYSFARENPNHYTGYQKQVYQIIKAQCPTTLVRTAKSLPGGSWGTAYMDQGYITMSTQIPAKHIKTVSLHECAHMRQWAMYGSGNLTFHNFSLSAAALYGTTQKLGIERLADCMANVWSRNSYFGYGNYCSGSRQSAATHLAKWSRYWR